VIYAYIRVSTDKQDLDNQRYAITEFCTERGYDEPRWVNDVVSGSKALGDRKIGKLLDELVSGDVLIVSEVSRLSRRLLDVMEVLKLCISRGITIHTVKEGYEFKDDINSQVMAFAFGLAAEIERRLISQRTKEALARKRAEGVVLGRPLGSHRHEQLKLHGKDDLILSYMEKNVSRAAIARMLDVNVKTLREYINRQKLEELQRWRMFKKTDV
jgi:putative DNA-invertase from lambdoid prophage Rac